MSPTLNCDSQLSRFPLSTPSSGLRPVTWRVECACACACACRPCPSVRHARCRKPLAATSVHSSARHWDIGMLMRQLFALPIWLLHRFRTDFLCWTFQFVPCGCVLFACLFVVSESGCFLSFWPFSCQVCLLLFWSPFSTMTLTTITIYDSTNNI